MLNYRAASLEALPTALLREVFDHVRDAPFCVKDADLRYLEANAAMIGLCNAAHLEAIIGGCSNDFFDAETSQQWDADDRAVIQSKRPLRRAILRTVSKRRRVAWLVVGRWPMFDAQRNVIGLTSIAQRLPVSARKEQCYQRVKAIAEDLQRDPEAAIDVAELASRHKISVSQLDRDFNFVFGVGPRRFLTNLRLERAIDLLGGEHSIAEVAHACGYKDQSAFARQFGVAFGMSPSKFRDKHARTLARVA